MSSEVHRKRSEEDLLALLARYESVRVTYKDLARQYALSTQRIAQLLHEARYIRTERARGQSKAR